MSSPPKVIVGLLFFLVAAGFVFAAMSERTEAQTDARDQRYEAESDARVADMAAAMGGRPHDDDDVDEVAPNYSDSWTMVGGAGLASVVAIGLIALGASPAKKQCPECAEWVQDEALVCRHCSHRFELA